MRKLERHHTSPALSICLFNLFIFCSRSNLRAARTTEKSLSTGVERSCYPMKRWEHTCRQSRSKASERKTNVSRLDFHKKRERAGPCFVFFPTFVLFPNEYFLCILLSSPRNKLEVLDQISIKWNGHILINTSLFYLVREENCWTC